MALHRPRRPCHSGPQVTRSPRTRMVELAAPRSRGPFGARHRLLGRLVLVPSGTRARGSRRRARPLRLVARPSAPAGVLARLPRPRDHSRAVPRTSRALAPRHVAGKGRLRSRALDATQSRHAGRRRLHDDRPRRVGSLRRRALPRRDLSRRRAAHRAPAAASCHQGARGHRVGGDRNRGPSAPRSSSSRPAPK